MALLLLLTAAVQVRAQKVSDSPALSFDYNTLIWTLSNSQVQIKTRLAGAGQGTALQIVSVIAADGTVWQPGNNDALSPANLLVSGTPVGDSTGWDSVASRAENSANGGLRQRTTLIQNSLNLQVVVVLEVHPNQPVIHSWLEVTNLGPAKFNVGQADFLRWRFAAAGPTLEAFAVSQYRTNAPFMFDLTDVTLSTVPQGFTVFSGAHADQCSWMALRDTTGHGLVMGWEYDGRAHVTATPFDAQVEVRGGPDNLNLDVAAGQTVVLPASFLGVFTGDWDEAGQVTRHYASAILALPAQDQSVPYLMYDSWAWGQDISEPLMRREADLAAAMGVEVFIVDLGWAKQLGDWQEDSDKFPSGMAAFSAYVHDLGMKLGLHWVPEEAAPTSPVLRANPDWASLEQNWYFGATSLCLSCAPVQGWAQQTLAHLVNDYQVDWITQDGEDLVKDSSQNSGYVNAVQGIDALVQYSRNQFPNVQWENNSDGGDMSTFEALKRYSTFASCDACPTLQTRQAVYGMSYVFPTRYIDRYVGDAPTKMTTRSAMFGGPWIVMNMLQTLTDDQRSLLRQEAAIYKSLRALIRDGRVYHLLNRPDGVSVDAIESFSPEQNRGVVFVYRPRSPNTSATIQLKGLNPATIYTITFQESTAVIHETGANLMSNGIKVGLPVQDFAEILYINPSH